MNDQTIADIEMRCVHQRCHEQRKRMSLDERERERKKRLFFFFTCEGNVD